MNVRLPVSERLRQGPESLFLSCHTKLRLMQKADIKEVKSIPNFLQIVYKLEKLHLTQCPAHYRFQTLSLHIQIGIKCPEGKSIVV